MTRFMDENDAPVAYYDSDYPSEVIGKYLENFDEITKFQGIALDVPRYREITVSSKTPVLELCCGTGRVAIPLARDGREVVAVDASKAMLAQFESNLRREDARVAERIKLVEADVTTLKLAQKFDVVLLPFNSLLLITDMEAQLSVLRTAREHLTESGIFVFDVVNPLALKLEGDPVPKPFFTRKNPHNGNVYTRFASCGPLDTSQRQKLYGFYDEVDQDGYVRRRFYSFQWRPIFRSELELLLRLSGLSIVSLDAGHSGEPITSAQNPRFFVQARRA